VSENPGLAWHDAPVRSPLAVLALSLACAAGAHAHGGGSHTGFVSTVSGIEPPQLGLLVQVLGGHERLSVRNLTQKTVVIFDEDGGEALRLAPGDSGSVADPRIGSTGPPPEEGEFVGDWRIPGEADGTPFVIVGFLGYRPPSGVEEDDSGLPVWAIVLAAASGAIVVAAALALPLRRREGEG
jgi:hypothetical protein